MEVVFPSRDFFCFGPVNLLGCAVAAVMQYACLQSSSRFWHHKAGDICSVWHPSLFRTRLPGLVRIEYPCTWVHVATIGNAGGAGDWIDEAGFGM